MSAYPTGHLPLAYLNDIVITPVSIQFEALTEVLLPPFPGPAIRGIIGNALLESWCQARPLCADMCLHPDSCRFYDRFARDREGAGVGENQPKPWILELPPPPGLTAIVAAGVISPPYALGPAIPGSFPLVERREPWVLPAGARFDFRISLVGRHGAWAGELAGLLRSRVFRMGLRAGRLGVVGTPQCLPAYRLSANPVPVRSARIEFLTPLRIHPSGGWDQPFDALVRQVATSAMVRAIKLHDNFCRNDSCRLPRMELPSHTLTVKSPQLWRYWLPRVSNKQSRTMEIGGIVGSLEVEGDLANLMPLLTAGETLHVGQKATFGLGRIRTVVWN